MVALTSENLKSPDSPGLDAVMAGIGARARAAAARMALAETDAKNRALTQAAAAIRPAAD